jgi:hypothetical protein
LFLGDDSTGRISRGDEVNDAGLVEDCLVVPFARKHLGRVHALTAGVDEGLHFDAVALELPGIEICLLAYRRLNEHGRGISDSDSERIWLAPKPIGEFAGVRREAALEDL